MRTCHVCGAPIEGETQLAYSARFFGAWDPVHRACTPRMVALPGFDRTGLRILSPHQAQRLRRASTIGAVTALLLWLLGTAVAFVMLAQRPDEALMPWLAGVSLGLGGPIALILAWEVLRVRRSLA